MKGVIGLTRHHEIPVSFAFLVEEIFVRPNRHPERSELEGSGNPPPASTQQRINDGFDMNHGGVEKLDARVARVPQQQWQLCARQD
jgi:hypothetical protein